MLRRLAPVALIALLTMPYVLSKETGQAPQARARSEEHTSELQSLTNLVCRLLLEKKKKETSDQASHETQRSPRENSSNAQSRHAHSSGNVAQRNRLRDALGKHIEQPA